MPNINKNFEIQKELEKLTTPPSIGYIIEQRNGPLLKLSVSHKTLLEWRDIKKRLPHVSFLELYRLSAQNVPLEIKPDAARLEERFRVLSSVVDKQCRGSVGYTRDTLLQKKRVIEVYGEELVHASSLRKQVEAVEKENVMLKEKLKEVDERCEELLVELLEEKRKLQQEREEVHNLEAEIEDLANENRELKSYINYVEESFACNNCNEELKNKGKNISEVGERQKIRKMKLLSSRAERALWFVDSFGLKLNSLSLQDKEGQSTQIPFGKSDGKKSNFSSLSEGEKDKIRAVLFIMDRLSVSDAAYHEFTMSTDGLERSYLVRQCRTDLNNLIHITRTPGKQPGIQMSFKEELQFHLREKMAKGQITKEKIKISGDGAKMSRIANFIVLSFAMLSDEESVMSAYGNHVFAIVSGKEDYNVLKVTCSEVFKEINDLIAQKSINVDGQDIALEFFLSGDYKFLLLLLGMNAANSTYACIYCTIPKTERWDMSKSEDHYWAEGITRTMEEIKQMAGKSKNNYGCLRQPLLNIQLDNIRVDELHLLLRITDILERNIIHSCIEWDNEEAVQQSAANQHLTNLVDAICKCGVAFSVWEKQNGDRKGSGHYEWSSMVGGDKKSVLEALPDKLDGLLQARSCQTVVQIWKEFKNLYDVIATWEPTQEMKTSFFGKATKWVNLFLSLGDEEDGYGKSKITPYIHIMCYHLPRFLKQETAVKRFTGQGIEKINDIVRSIYHKKSNKHDACSEALLALKRIDRLQDYQREPQTYVKRNIEYWSTDIYEQRKKRLRFSVEPRENSHSDENTHNIDDLSIAEIKDKLKTLGIKTRIRSLEKLRELLHSKL